MDYNDTKGWKEDRYEDFKEFLAQKKWSDAQAVIADFEENGLKEHWDLRKEFIQAQFHAETV